MKPSLFVIASACFVGCWLPPAHAREPLPKLVVRRGEKALDCPDAQTLAQSVEKHLKRKALDPTEGNSPAGALLVEIEGGSEGYKATVKAGDLVREISDPWKDCSGLAQGLPLVIAILLDDEHTSLAPASQSPPPAPSPEARVLEPAVPAPAPDPPKTVAIPTESPPTPTRISFTKKVFRAELMAALSSGWTGSAVPGMFGMATFGLPFLRAELGALWFVDQSVDHAPGSVDISLAAAHIAGCGRLFQSRFRIELWACAESRLGVLTGSAQGFAENQTEHRPWLALGASLAFEVKVNRWVGLTMRGGFGALPSLERFSVLEAEERQALVFDPPRIGFLLSAGPTLTIW